jgi:large repetitive protein
MAFNLHPKSVTGIPATVKLSTSFDITWTGEKTGSDPTSGYWYDSVYLSTTPDFSSGTLVGLSNGYVSESDLAEDGTYEITRTLNISPDSLDSLDLTGPLYLLFVIDASGSQTESDETDNILAVPIQVEVPDVDLTGSVTAPATAIQGETITVDLTVSNSGTDDADGGYSGYRSDRVWLSQDQTLDASDTSLYYFGNGPVAAGDSVTQTYGITIPNVDPGDYYLIFETDSDNYQAETDEANNIAVSPITVIANDVDLQVTEASAPDQANFGQTITVDWTVANSGTQVADNGRYDYIYLSTDDTFDYTDQYLGYTYTSGTGTQTTNAYIPTKVTPGNYNLLFVADRYNYEPEINETNNTASRPITITAPTAPPIVGTISAQGGLVNADLSTTDANNPTFSGSYSDDYQLINFTVGEEVTLNMSAGNYGPFIQLVNAETQQIVSEAYGNLIFTPQANIDYTVRATSYYSGGVTGTYSLTANTSNTRPDLIVSASNAPDTANWGEYISVDWTVQNNSQNAANGAWYDSVYLSDDDQFDANDHLLTYRYTYSTSLAAGQTYQIEDYSVSLYNYSNGNIVTGDKYLIYKTDKHPYTSYDDNGSLAESNEANNWRAEAITINAPDLLVTASSAPDTATLNQNIEVSFTVKNQGASVTSNYQYDWYDSVYLSDDDQFDASDRQIGYFYRTTALGIDETYTTTANITVPTDASTGTKYLIYRADGGNYKAESDEINNWRAEQITIGAPDLTISDLTATATAAVSEVVEISWTVTNIGNDSANANYWYDQVYLSKDSVWDSNDVYMTYSNQYEPLSPGESYTRTINATIPNITLDGSDYYLIVKADNANQQGETNETNNVIAKAISLSASDLVITSSTAPDTATLSQTIEVSFTVKNQGTGATPNNWYDWYDGVYLSDDDQLDANDRLIGSFYRNAALGVNETYTTTTSITLPTDAGTGAKYLIYKADAGNYRAETNETNNWRAEQITIGATDLVISNATSPTAAIVGETVSLSWDVTNTGTVNADANYWIDFVYLSKDAVWDNSDTYITNVWRNGPLLPGASYTQTVNAAIPNITLDGSNYYLLFKTDAYNYQGETNEDNNVVAKAISLSAPDLTIANAAVTARPRTGAANLGEANPSETISLSWTVKNQGSTATGSSGWYDTVYLSDDAVLDDSDRALNSQWTGNIEYPISLDPNETYTVNRDLKLPNDITSGSKYLIFKTDSYSNQAETNETNNTYSVALNVTEKPDLQISNASAPDFAVVNQQIQVGWTVTNVGNVTAAADWYDYVYLSTDTTLGSDDQMVYDGYYDNTFSTALTAGDSYSVTNKTLTLPTATAGNYFLLFATDDYYGNLGYGDNQAETDETSNNVVVKAITIGAPDLQASEVTTNKTSVGINESFDVSWKVTNTGSTEAPAQWYDSVYLSTDTTLDGADTQLSGWWNNAATPLAAGAAYSRTATVSTSLTDGTYYLLVKADSGNYQGETSETNNVAVGGEITVGRPDLIVESITAPATAGRGQTIEISYSVKNQGTAAAATYVYDKIYYSQNNVFGDADDRWLNTVQRLDTIAAGVSATATTTAVLPNDINVGAGYIFVKADANEYQTETNDTNNVLSKAIQVGNAGSLALDRASYKIGEDGVPVNAVTVTRTGGSDGAVSAQLSFTNGTATIGSDLTGTPIMVNFANGQTSQIVTIPISDDLLIEGDETFTLTLVDPTGGASLGTQTNATVTIDENDGLTLNGTGAGETLNGGIGDDTINGLAGRDSLNGGVGDDTIVGGLGSDTITTGAGRDRIVFNSLLERVDRVTDFNVNEDVVDMRAIFASLGYSGSNPISDGYLRIISSGANTNIEVDSNGTVGGQNFDTVVTLNNVAPSSLTAANYRV